MSPQHWVALMQGISPGKHTQDALPEWGNFTERGTSSPNRYHSPTLMGLRQCHVPSELAWKIKVVGLHLLQVFLNFIYNLAIFFFLKICFHFCFQETNSLSNYQFLFQDLAITTLIGVTSKNFKASFCGVFPCFLPSTRQGLSVLKAGAGLSVA